MSFNLTLEEQVEYDEAQLKLAVANLKESRRALEELIKDGYTQSSEALEQALQDTQTLSESEALFGSLTEEEKSLDMKTADDYFGVGGSESPNPELDDYNNKHGT